MPLDFNSYLTAVNGANMEDNALIHASRDGTRVSTGRGRTLFMDMITSSREAANRRNVQEFLHVLQNDVRFQEVLGGDLSARLQDLIEHGAPLTAGVVRNAEGMLRSFQARKFATECAQAGRLCGEAAARRFSAFMLSSGRVPETPQQKAAVLKDFLAAEFIESPAPHLMNIGLESSGDERTAAPLVRRLADARAGGDVRTLFRSHLAGCATVEDIHFEALARIVPGLLARDAGIIRELDGATVQLLSFVRDPASAMDMLADARAAAGANLRDLAALIGSQDPGISTPAARGALMRRFMAGLAMNGLEETLAERDAELGLPRGLAAALMRNPAVADAVDAALRAQCGDACPSREQADAAVKAALDDFFLSCRPAVTAFLDMARENGLGLRPPVTPERLPAFINVLLASEAATAPLFDNALNCSSKEYLVILEDFCRAAESGRFSDEGLSAADAMKAAVELNLRLRCPDAHGREAAAARASVILGSLQPGLKALGTGMGITGSRLRQVCEAVLAQTVSGLDDEALKHLGMRFSDEAGRNRAVADHASGAGNSMRAPTLRDTTRALRELAAEHGAVLPANLGDPPVVPNSIQRLSQKTLDNAMTAYELPEYSQQRAAALEKLNFDGRFNGVDLRILMRTDSLSLHNILQAHADKACENARKAGVPVTEAEAQGVMLEAFREICTRVKSVLDAVDALPEQGDVAFTAAGKTIMKDMAQRYGMLSLDTLKAALALVRTDDAYGPGGLGRLLRPGLSPLDLEAVLEDIHESCTRFMLDHGLGAENESGSCVHAMLLNMALRSLGIAGDGLRQLEGLAAGPESLLVTKAMNKALEIVQEEGGARDTGVPLGVIQNLLQLRRAAVLEQGGSCIVQGMEGSDDPGSMEELGSLGVVTARLAWGENAPRTVAMKAVSALRGGLAPAGRRRLADIITGVLEETAPHEKEWNFDRSYDRNIVASLLAASHEQLLQAPVRNGRPAPADIWRAVTGERMPKGVPQQGLGYRLFSRCADEIQQLRDAALGRSEGGGRRRAVDALRACAGMPFSRIRELMRPGAKLFKADLPDPSLLPAGTGGVRPDNDYGLAWGWGLAAPGSTFRFAGAGDGKDFRSEITRSSDLAEKAWQPARRKDACTRIIAMAERMSESEMQKTRLLQCLSAMPPQFLKDIINILPGLDSGSLGQLEAVAEKKENGAVTVKVASSPDALLRLSAELVILADGSCSTVFFSLERRDAGRRAPVPAPIGPRGRIPAITLADGTVVRLANLAGPEAARASGARADAARAGLVESAKELLAAFSGREGGPFALPLMRSLGMMKAWTDRLIALGTLRPEDVDSAVEGFLAAAVEALSPDEFQQAFRQFASEDVSGLRRALHAASVRDPGNGEAMAAEAVLFQLDALLLREAGIRMANVRAAVAEAEGAAPEERPVPLAEGHGGGFTGAPAQRNADPDRRLTDKGMAVLLGASEGGAGRMAEAERIMREDYRFDRQIREADLKKLGDALRAAPLTINVDAGYFFSPNGPLSFLDDEWKNLFHAFEEGHDIKGPGYRAKRDAVERTVYPQYGATAPVRPGERPTYAALNTARRTAGGAMPYGSVAITLRDDVKRRCVFTVNDTFLALRLRADKPRIDAFKRLLGSLEGLSDGCRRALGDRNGPLWTRLDAMLDDLLRQGAFDSTAMKRIFERLGGVKVGNHYLMNDDDRLLIEALFLKVFRDAEATGKNLATYENIESLIPHMTDVDVMQLIDAYSRRGGRTAQLESNYFEAHIHGGFSLANDVKEITVDRVMTDGTDQEIAYMDAVMDVFNGRKIPRDRLGMLSGEQKTRLDGLKNRLGGRTIPMRWSDSNEDLNGEAPVRESELRFMSQHFSLGNLNEIMERIQTDEGFRKLAGTFLRTAPGGLKNLFPEDAFPPGEDIENLRACFMARCGELELHPEQLEAGSEPENAALERALEDVYGHERLEAARLLGREVAEVLHAGNALFDNPGALRTAAEFARRILHGTAAVTEDLHVTVAASIAFSDVLSTLAGDGGPDVGGLVQQLAQMPQDWFGKAAAAEGFRTALAALDDRQKAAVLHKLEACREELAGVGAALARLCDPRDGLAGMYSGALATCALAVRHLLGWADVQNGREAARLERFEGDLSLLDQSQRRAVAAAFPEVGELLEKGHPPIPAFPAPARPDLIPSTPEEERNFLKQMLPVYQAHEGADGFDRSIGFHGRGHICRAFILASAMASIMEERGVHVNRGVLLCGITGHDSGRTHNGTDTEEAASAGRTIEHIGMYANGGRPGPIDPLGPQAAEELRRCIVGHQSKTIEGILLNSADSLDIGRVRDYDFQYLAFLRGASEKGNPVEIPDDDKLRKGLQAEAMLLAKLTDPIVAGRMNLAWYDREIMALDDLLREGRIDAAAKNREEERLQAEKEMFLDSMHKSMNILQDIQDQEEFISFIEEPIRSNPQLFPLLSRYYLRIPPAPPLPGSGPAAA